MNDRELLEFIAAQVGNLTVDMKEVKEKVNSIDSRLTKVELEFTGSGAELKSAPRADATKRIRPSHSGLTVGTS